ncbi:multiple resistance and pH regulation protein F [Ancylobacter sp. Lp-2]|uniref:monovalent cation/H+ antiporter complex subunit F n=1 Tax=Ancylobacter sp. Lp-2 TaxID=2881339 RepID=UPI001E49DE0A|nr:monovalent cation/H+ antiporter complex subunit F [Ancylobacter sp. Lp-2]MCB4769331.1 multiple resistance and pH regulation protein F [Ancylobacter sp. Lp-2]
MSAFLTAAAAFVAATAGLGLLRLLRGPAAVDRMMAVQLAGTAGAAVCLLLATGNDSPALVDVALTLAVLAALGTAAMSRKGRDDLPADATPGRPATPLFPPAPGEKR